MYDFIPPSFAQSFDIPISAWIVQTKEEVDEVLLKRGKLILLTEDVPDYLNSPQYGSSCLMANCLLPDYEAISYYLDNDPQTFSRVYNELLLSPESAMYFTTMLSAMINNIPLGFLFGSEEIEQASTVNFINFLAVTYGIHLGHKYPFNGEPPMEYGFMDRNYVPKNVGCLYMNNLLTPQEFLFIYPEDALITFDMMQKLVFDLRPPLKNPNNLEEIAEYMSNFREAIKRTNKQLIDPLVMG